MPMATYILRSVMEKAIGSRYHGAIEYKHDSAGEVEEVR